MSHDIENATEGSQADFSLQVPGNQFADVSSSSPAPPVKPNRSSGGGDDQDSTGGGGGSWKGFEEEEEDEEPEMDFGGSEIPEDELDMTPMVDVTFLLLIFFMVTASFTLRKSFEQAQSESDDPSENVVEQVDDTDDFVEVFIDQTNTYYIRTRETEEVEAPSEREMKDLLRESKQSIGAKRLIIRAHVDALHSKVVAVLDIGNSVGMEKIETVISEVDY